MEPAKVVAQGYLWRFYRTETVSPTGRYPASDAAGHGLRGQHTRLSIAATGEASRCGCVGTCKCRQEAGPSTRYRYDFYRG